MRALCVFLYPPRSPQLFTSLCLYFAECVQIYSRSHYKTHKCTHTHLYASSFIRKYRLRLRKIKCLMAHILAYVYGIFLFLLNGKRLVGKHHQCHHSQDSIYVDSTENKRERDLYHTLLLLLELMINFQFEAKFWLPNQKESKEIAGCKTVR